MRVSITGTLLVLLFHSQPLFAATGVTDTEIRIGQTMPYSGPASSFAAMGLTEASYYAMINDHGGIAGRRIKFISLDDGFLPNRTVEQTRRLVEQDDVLAIVGSLGTPTNAAVQRYLNQRKVPQLFISTGAARFADPTNFPWTIALGLNQSAEAHIHARRLVATAPEAHIGVLYQDDDFGREYLQAFRTALGDRAATMIVKETSYQAQDPTIDQQLLALRGAGADTLLAVAIPRFAALVIRRTAEMNWKPLQIIPQPSISIVATLRPAGVSNAIGVVGAEIYKDPADPRWDSDPEMADYRNFMHQYRSSAEISDRMNLLGYVNASAVIQLLHLCGDNITRPAIMHQASHLDRMRTPLMLPGITLSTTPTEYAAIRQMQLQRFDGQQWQPIGDVVTDREPQQ